MPAKGVCLHAENLSLALLFLIGRHFSSNQKRLLFSLSRFYKRSQLYILYSDDSLTSVRRKASGNMKPLLLAIFKFCTTNQLFTFGEGSKIDLWLQKNKLSLNYSKSNYMIVNGNPKKTVDDNFKLILNNSALIRASSVKYLGLHIDENLNWSVH